MKKISEGGSTTSKKKKIKAQKVKMNSMMFNFHQAIKMKMAMKMMKKISKKIQIIKI